MRLCFMYDGKELVHKTLWKHFPPKVQISWGICSTEVSGALPFCWALKTGTANAKQWAQLGGGGSAAWRLSVDAGGTG